MNRVFVTGLGAVTPIGIGIEEFAAGLRAGRSGVGPITSFDASQHSVKIAAEVKGFDPSPYIAKKEIRRHDRYSQFAMAASHMALQQARLEPGTFDPRRVGVIFSTGIGGIQTFEAEHDVIRGQGPGRVSPFLVPMMICNIASGYIAMAHGFKGPNFCVVSACASGLHGMGEAYLKLAHGLIDICVTGGAEAAITPLTVAGFAQMKALSTRNDAPEKASRPFDADRDGFVMGEGAGALIFETEASMQRRGVTPLAEVIGYGASADAYHLTAPEPNGEGAFQAMSEAIAFRQTPPTTFNYVNCHGTSTPLGDVAEILAIKRVFGDHAKSLMVNATKSMIGHLLGAAGAVGAVATVLQISRGFVHPTINLDRCDERIDLDCVPHTAREARIEAALVNSFGFGGQNACLAFRRV
ncbi:MAG: 3-oxoacyl-[acyl-carrier-protein] synthase, KASII [Candidatus Ozemobacter sibiricus]|uniref:3-oxoacyl-[acyl-carrier-protein] synthase 2 n=1 Tax=Candidatus Ozemobacter sibiricus TaxID=2268124 RepID=A0A367ZRF4_9BACT|nr:MAG: 3-oxoacyl-[acyl-carrier-protein] synthase, KASII [Candidatus Ozemobacter sibiricus]